MRVLVDWIIPTKITRDILAFEYMPKKKNL